MTEICSVCIHTYVILYNAINNTTTELLTVCCTCEQFTVSDVSERRTKKHYYPIPFKSFDVKIDELFRY